MIDYGGHDWAAVVGAQLETGDPPVAYVCQLCGRVLPGQIIIVSPRDEAWLQSWLALEENAAAEVQRADHLPPGAAYLADPRAIDLQACQSGRSIIEWAAARPLTCPPGWLNASTRPPAADIFGRIKIT